MFNNANYKIAIHISNDNVECTYVHDNIKDTYIVIFYQK